MPEKHRCDRYSDTYSAIGGSSGWATKGVDKVFLNKLCLSLLVTLNTQLVSLMLAH